MLIMKQEVVDTYLRNDAQEAEVKLLKQSVLGRNIVTSNPSVWPWTG